tara:strand:+ start:5649 stop:6833 length:1185 start_codon:yes stop_codon:yes gene_type:complete
MIFHSIDIKQNCKSVIVNNNIINDPDYSAFSGSWDYNMDHKNDQIQYANLYLQGKSIDQVCPPHLQEQWEAVKQKHTSFIQSFKTAKVKAGDYCFYDLVPEYFLIEFFGTKCKIIEYILDTYEKPQNYDFLLELRKMIMDIEQNKLNLNMSALHPQMHKYKVRKFYEKVQKISPYVAYNLFGTITGRLTTKKGSFPMLTLDRDYRSMVVPNNNFFLELDFNGAELRCLLALSGLEQPTEDIHAWNVSHVYKKTVSREEAKRRIFAWLYNLGSNDLLSSRAYDREALLEKYFDGECVQTPFGRKIKCDKFHAINFLIQSTSSDIFLRRAIAVHKLLKNKKTKVAGLIHDSILLDFADEDKHLLPEIVKTFQETDFGTFKVNKSIGLTFGNMLEIQ